MKVRKQKASPCLKKGIDNYLVTNLCEHAATCKLNGDYLNSKSELYKLCLNVEHDLTDNQLIRYELREMSGLEVLFEGIEKIYNLNSEIFNYDYFEGIGPNDFTQLAMGLDNSTNDLKKDLLFKQEDALGKNQKIVLVESFEGSDFEPNILNHLPESLGFAQSFGHDLLSSNPDNLFDSFFESLYQSGEFEPQFIEIKGESVPDRIKRELKDDDFHCVATLLLKGIENENDIQRFWPRYTKSRYEKNKNKVYSRVNKKMPAVFKKFDKIWSQLTEPQIEALELEFFHGELEKPTQEQNAEKLGISIASYQDRLELVYKKFSKLYPEFERIRRRKPRSPISEGELKTSPRKLPPAKLAEIKQWAKENMESYFNSYRSLVQDWVIIDNDDDEEENRPENADS